MILLCCLSVFFCAAVFGTAVSNAATVTTEKTLSTPKINAPANTASGVKLSWGKVAGAVKYRVFTKNGTGWKKLNDTTATSLVHSAAVSGKTYTYTVRCVTSDGKTYTSSYDKTGKTITFISTPTFKTTVNTSSGPLLDWTASVGAYKYRLFLYSGGKWVVLTDTTSSAYIHTSAAVNTTYKYKICCLDKNGKIVSDYRSINHTFSKTNATTAYTKEKFANTVYSLIGSKAGTISNPNAPLNRNIAAAILVKALNYELRVKIALSDSTDNSMYIAAYFGFFTPDTGNRIYPERLVTASEYSSLTADVKYYAALKGKQLLVFGDSIMYGTGNNGYGIAKMFGEKYGMKFHKKNNGVAGATFSSVKNDRPHIIDQIEDARSRDLQADVILLNGGTNDMILVNRGTTPDKFDTKKPAESPFAKGFEAIMKEISTNWSGVPVIYVRAHNMDACPDTLENQMGEYGNKIAKKWGASIVDVYNDASLNTENSTMCTRYTKYNVDKAKYDSIHPNALCYASYYLPLMKKHFPGDAPIIATPTNTANGIKLTWSYIGSTAQYRVLVKNGSSWKKIGDTDKNYFVHTGLASGTKVTYTVRGLSANGNSYTSSYNHTGRTATFIAEPVFNVNCRPNDIRIAWDAVKGAAKYRVFVKNSLGNWEGFTDTTGVSCSYKPPLSGVSYTFTVRCLSKNGGVYTSSYHSGKTVTFVASPTIESITDEPEGARITWNASNGAAMYRVFAKQGNTWKALGDTKELSFLHAVNDGETYAYSIRCLNKSANVISEFDSDGVTHTYHNPLNLPAPTEAPTAA